MRICAGAAAVEDSKKRAEPAAPGVVAVTWLIPRPTREPSLKRTLALPVASVVDVEALGDGGEHFHGAVTASDGEGDGAAGDGCAVSCEELDDKRLGEDALHRRHLRGAAEDVERELVDRGKVVDVDAGLAGVADLVRGDDGEGVGSGDESDVREHVAAVGDLRGDSVDGNGDIVAADRAGDDVVDEAGDADGGRGNGGVGGGRGDADTRCGDVKNDGGGAGADASLAVCGSGGDEVDAFAEADAGGAKAGAADRGSDAVDHYAEAGGRQRAGDGGGGRGGEAVVGGRGDGDAESSRDGDRGMGCLRDVRACHRDLGGVAA